MGERRDLLWQLGELDYQDDELPFTLLVSEVELPALDDLEQTAWEYELLGLSPAGQTMRHFRPALDRGQRHDRHLQREAREDQAQRLHDLDRGEEIKSEKVEDRRKIIW